jgi:hypothetical protein
VVKKELSLTFHPAVVSMVQVCDVVTRSYTAAGHDTEEGDLRIGRFSDMYALQIIPSVGYFLSRPSIAQRTARPVTWL